MQRIDLTGQRFGRLTVLTPAPTGRGGTTWRCRCDCGNEVVRLRKTLRNGMTRSCGCLRNETSGARTRTHGQSGTRLHHIWCGLRKRAGKAKGYEHVTVCPEWQSFEPFRDWALAHGYADHLSIDRRENAKGYVPGNCRWATPEQQVRNSSKVRPVIRSDGKRYETASDAATDVGGQVSKVVATCRGRRPSHNGYSWYYLDRRQ